MCGIAGIIDFKGTRPVQTDELERMAQSLAHRGPDEQGLYLDRRGCCGLAHRRLAVIDPEGGKQPLCNEEKTLWISYNGECYNFAELRGDLEALGHRFKTRCDTEVVLHLYEQYGAECVEYMRGMFGLAVWDEKKSQLFLARDRLGQKPLYYAVHDGRFIFASECKAILQVEGFPRRIDTEGIAGYLLLQYVPNPRSGFADIKQLPPAHSMTVNRANYAEVSTCCYWSVSAEPNFAGSFDEALEQVRAELTEAVRLRLVSDVPLGAFLSGGLDSTIVVGLMNSAGGRSTKTCAIGFDEPRYNELDFARQVAQRYGCDHDEHIVRSDCLDVVEKLSYYYDEPFADCSAVPTYYLAHRARAKVTVALTGDGGDECFGGYDRYKALRLAERVNRSRLLRWLVRRGFWQRLFTPEHHSRWHGLKRFMAAAALPVDRCYLKWLAVFDPDMLGDLLTDGAFAMGQWAYLARFFHHSDAFETESDRYVAQAMFADANTYLPGDLNCKIDRASMSTGLELRCPFQDHKVVELAYSLPAGWRHNGSVSKYILRRACGDLLPETISRRAKMGFGVPVGRWFRGDLRGLFVDTVLSKRALERGLFNRGAIEKLLWENDQRRDDHGHRLWALLMLELWQQRYIDNKPN